MERTGLDYGAALYIKNSRYSGTSYIQEWLTREGLVFYLIN